jgi:hypothetical protein
MIEFWNDGIPNPAVNQICCYWSIRLSHFAWKEIGTFAEAIVASYVWLNIHRSMRESDQCLRTDDLEIPVLIGGFSRN